MRARQWVNAHLHPDGGALVFEVWVVLCLIGMGTLLGGEDMWADSTLSYVAHLYLIGAMTGGLLVAGIDAWFFFPKRLWRSMGWRWPY